MAHHVAFDETDDDTWAKASSINTLMIQEGKNEQLPLLSRAFGALTEV